MQLKQDTEYALRIMTCMAEEILDDGEKTGIPVSKLISATGIPRVTFDRICRSLEKRELIRRGISENNGKLLCPGENFWEQNILSIGEAVEGNMKIFVIFDRNSGFMRTYGKTLGKTQKRLDHILAKATLESMVRGR